jgi:hypothetical protein
MNTKQMNYVAIAFLVIALLSLLRGDNIIGSVLLILSVVFFAGYPESLARKKRAK